MTTPKDGVGACLSCGGLAVVQPKPGEPFQPCPDCIGTGKRAHGVPATGEKVMRAPGLPSRHLPTDAGTPLKAIRASARDGDSTADEERTQ